MTTALFYLALILAVLSLVAEDEEEPEHMFPEWYDASEEAELIIEQYLQEIGEESI